MQVVLDRQKQAYINEGIVTAETRIDRIDRAIDILETNGTRLTEAMMADFGHRSIDQSRATDIEGSIGPLKHIKTCAAMDEARKTQSYVSVRTIRCESSC